MRCPTFDMPARVFMISRDPSAEQASSATAARLDAYRTAGAELVVRALTPRSLIRILRDGLRTVGRGWVVTAQDPFEAGLVAWFIAWMRGARLELQMHGDFLNPAWWREVWHRPIRLVLARVLLRRADGVRVPGERVARSLAGLVPAERIVKVPVAPTPGAVRGEPVEWQRVLLAARFSPEKDIPLLVRAFASIASRFPQAVLVLRGEGPEIGRIQAEVRSVRGLLVRQDQIQFQRPFTPDDPSPDTAGVVVISSRHESWSRIAVEAALAGRAVVMTDVGCAGEVIIDGESGWVVPPGDEAAFAAALADALARPDEARRRGENARKAAEALPSGSDVARRIVAAWYRLVGA